MSLIKQTLLSKCVNAQVIAVKYIFKLAVPVFAAMYGNYMLCGVEEPLAIVRPGQGARSGIGTEFDSEAQALPLFDISLHWSWAA